VEYLFNIPHVSCRTSAGADILNRFSHFCTYHGRVSSGTMAPPGEYDWTFASLGPPESTTQTANRSVQPFLHSSLQIAESSQLYNGHFIWYYNFTLQVAITSHHIILW